MTHRAIGVGVSAVALWLGADERILAADEGAVTEIVITGSRLSSDSFQQPTPVQAVAADFLRNAAPTTLVESLRRLPALMQSNDNMASGQQGGPASSISGVNLRSLGGSRSLVLVDGHRITASTNGGTVDLSLLPQNMIRRVDVVTGGASATYGSDAVSGVVNFIIDRRFQGFKLDAGAGVDQHGDGLLKKISGAAGRSFFDGRVHGVLSGEYFELDNVLASTDRAWTQRDIALIPNPAVTAATATASNPTFFTRPNVRFSNGTIGGLVTSGPLAGTDFVDGQPQPFIYGSDRSASAMVGGSSTGIPRRPDLGLSLNRKNVYAGLGFEIAPQTTAYLSANWANQHGLSHSGSATFQTTAFSGNPYLPATTQAEMTRLGLASLPVAKALLDLGNSLYDETRILELHADVDGTIDLGGKTFDWNAGVSHGNTRNARSAYEVPHIYNFYNAIDAVMVTPQNVGTSGLAVGSIACRTSLTVRNGCVPWNLFLPATQQTDQAFLYVLGREPYQGGTSSLQKQEMDSAEISISGEPFSLWAGPVATATGVHYRKLSIDITGDPISFILPATYLAENPGLRGLPANLANATNRGLFSAGNFQPSAGSYNVRELFAEANVPLVSSDSFLRTLSVNGAYRYADYSNAGGIGAWKVGTVADLPAGLRLRATLSRDIRAGTMAELYQATRTTQVSVTDRAINQSFQINGVSQGNPGVRPELSDNLTAGVVFQRGRLAMSVDYYDITVNDAIGTPAPQFIVDQCFAGLQEFCARITRTNGLITSIQTAVINQSKVKTSGVDFDANYAVDSADIIPGTSGMLTWRFSAAHVRNLTSYLPRAAPNETLGTAGNPRRWSGMMSLGYSGDRLSVSVIERYFGPGALDRTYNTDEYTLPGTPVAYVDNNKVQQQFVTDLSLRYAMQEGKIELYSTIQNLFDKDPPLVPRLFSATPLQTSPPYDIQGRRFVAGVRLRY